MEPNPQEKMLRWEILDNGNTRTDDEGDFVYFLDAADMIAQCEARVAELGAQLAEMTRKGEELCQAYGVSLIRIHDLEAALWSSVIASMTPGTLPGHSLKPRSEYVHLEEPWIAPKN